MSQKTRPPAQSVGSHHPSARPAQPPMAPSPTARPSLSTSMSGAPSQASAAASGGTPNRRAAGELEREVLSLLWSADEPLMPFQVQQRLGGGLAQSTVATTLLRLMDKGLADRAPQGKGFGYRALKRAEDHAAVQMVALVRRGQNPDDVLRCFASQLPAGYQRVLREALTVAG